MAFPLGLIDDPDGLSKGYIKQQAYNSKFIHSLYEISDFNSFVDLNLKNEINSILRYNRTFFCITAHWGNYFKALMSVGASFPTASKFFTVRGRAWDDIEEEKLWSKINSESQYNIRVFSKNSSALTFLRLLNEGSHALLLYDLDKSYGRVVSTEFFGIKIFLGAGWIDLAYRYEALILIINPDTVFGDQFGVHQVIDSRAFASKEEFREFCANKLGEHLECLIRKRREVWFKWAEFDAFLKNYD